MRKWRGLCDPELWRPHTQGLGRGSRGGWNVGSVAPKGLCGISVAESFLAQSSGVRQQPDLSGLHFHIYEVGSKGIPDLTVGCKKWMSSCK